MNGKYDKILYEVLGKTKVREGIFIALDGPLGPGISHTISLTNFPKVLNALKELIKMLKNSWLIANRKGVKL